MERYLREKEEEHIRLLSVLWLVIGVFAWFIQSYDVYRSLNLVWLGLGILMLYLGLHHGHHFHGKTI